MPHGWNYYECKIFYTINNERKEITLKELFNTDSQKEWLRQTCENAIKRERVSHFVGKELLRETLTLKDIHTFVIDDKNLIIIFQPYIVVDGGADGPFMQDEK